MKKRDFHDVISACKARLGTYKYVLLVIAAGILLLFWPQREQDTEQVGGTVESSAASVDLLEEKLEEKLANMKGVGRVSVVLTVERGGETEYATDRRMDGEEREETLVILSEGGGKEAALPEMERSPTYRGALVICQGGGDPAVRLLVTQAVSVLTGLGADRITVCQGN